MHITDETLTRIASSRFCRGLPGYRGRGFRDRLRRAVLGDLDADILASTRWKVAEGHVRMDAVSAAILHHHGINPAVAAICGLIATTASFEHGQAAWTVTDRKVLAPLCADYAGFWASGMNVLNGLARIPETVALQAPGRPLRELLAHPALDALPLRILEVRSGTVDSLIAIEEPPTADLSTHLPAA